MWDDVCEMGCDICHCGPQFVTFHICSLQNGRPTQRAKSQNRMLVIMLCFIWQAEHSLECSLHYISLSARLSADLSMLDLPLICAHAGDGTRNRSPVHWSSSDPEENNYTVIRSSWLMFYILSEKRKVSGDER